MKKFLLIPAVIATLFVRPAPTWSGGIDLAIRSTPNGVAIEWLPKPAGQSNESPGILPDYVVESSDDLEHWVKTGDPIAGGLVAAPEKQALNLPAGEARRFYRLSGRYHLADLDLSSLSLINADLRGADLVGANLSGADLSGAKLQGANLSGARLTATDLRGADLEQADLTNADLTGANLIGANLDQARFHEDALSAAITTPTEEVNPPAEGDLSFGATPGAAAGAPGNLGFAVGGAKDINNFRENIENDFLPIFTDVTYEGLFYDYFFDTGQEEACEQTLFCPSYSQAISSDPFSGEAERYLSVGLNSNIQESDFERKQLNLAIVLDVSGSMSSPFNRYYYDQFGNRVDLEETEEDFAKQKMQVASEAVVALLDHLAPADSLGIVLFNNHAQLLEPLTPVSDINLEALKDEILSLAAGGGTAMSRGMEMGASLYEEFLEIDLDATENRIIFLTDAQPNIGVLGEDGLLGMTRANAEQHVYTTFIGIGVDFNTELIEHITKIRGANYYSVHSPDQFIERMDEGFDYMVTPLVFNLQLTLAGEGYAIEKVYGSPEADEATGQVMKVNTLFPSKTENGETRGGIILLKLAPTEEAENRSDRLTLSVSYEDRLGNPESAEVTVEVINEDPEYYENGGIQKAVLLTRYANLLKNWINDERQSYEETRPVIPIVSDEVGIPIPIKIELGRWERQSVPLFVSQPYRERFAQFLEYFNEQAAALEDESLQQETSILEKLSSLLIEEEAIQE